MRSKPSAKSRVAAVIDLKLLRENPDAVRASQRARGEDSGLVDALLEADIARRAAVSAADNLRAEQKAVSKQVGKATPDERPLRSYYRSKQVQNDNVKKGKNAGAST